MKSRVKKPHLRIYKTCQPLYPNAAEPRYYRQKTLDIVTAVVSMAGFVSAMVFLATMA